MRGLKPAVRPLPLAFKVAPLVGAWIETLQPLTNVMPNVVAPLVGAWIETKRVQSYWFYLDVAPLVGAWIETEMRDIQYQGLERRTPRGCVD